AITCEVILRHCERSEAIHEPACGAMDCFVADAPRNDDTMSVLNRLQLAIGEPDHLQQQPAVAETRDLGLAEGARLVVDRRFDDFEILFCCAEDQIEIAERVEITEIGALPRQYFVVLSQ